MTSHSTSKKMKNANLIGTFLLSIALATGLTGCKHRTPSVTPIPDASGRPTAGPGSGGTADNSGTANPNGGVNSDAIPLSNGDYTSLFAGGGTEDPSKFAADTVYFDFDSSTIRPSEESKLQEIASYFKDNKKFEGLIISGNCDQRGTEKYNLSLGERRALAAREYLINLGVDGHRIKTVTYGASKPAEPGNDEAAWKKNRRDEFILVTGK
jgi:peptidoglycan-associated lipoprotein